MDNLYVLIEYFTNGYRLDILDFVSLISVLCGILVIVTKNPIVSVLFLIGLFFSISCYLTMLGINFIGLAYLLVYVGAVSILFLFILMLINVRISELLSNTSNSLLLAIIIAIFFSYPVDQTLPSHSSFLSSNLFDFNSVLSNISNNSRYLFKLLDSEQYNGKISFVTGKIWDGNLSETSHITSIGNIMYTSYSIWLVITSIILLLAMVGSIVITIKQKD